MKIVRFVIALTVLILAFQNCGRSNFEEIPAVSNPPSSSKAVAQTKEYSKIRHFSEVDHSGSGIKDVSVDLASGEVSYNFFDSRKASCALNDDRLNQLDSLLAHARVCEAVREAGMAYCMAIGIPDVALSNAEGELTLQPIICGSGRDLCGADSAKLRELLLSLRQSPPAGCR